jgi:hypothetical protein
MMGRMMFYTQAKNVLVKPKEEEQEYKTKRRRDVTVTLDCKPYGILPAAFQFVHNALTVRPLLESNKKRLINQRGNSGMTAVATSIANHCRLIEYCFCFCNYSR